MKKILLSFITFFFITAVYAGSLTSDATETNVKHLSKKEFLEKIYNYEKNPDKWVYEGDKPAIVDFYATWCGPCKVVAPILEELANEYAGKIVIYKIDTDKERELSAAFGIQSIPTLLFIPMKGDPQVAQGALPKESLKRAIDEFLLGNKWFYAFAFNKDFFSVIQSGSEYIEVTTFFKL